MKKGLLIFVLFFSFLRSEGQTPFRLCYQPWCAPFPDYYIVDFEYDSLSNYFYFDSTQTNNIWQIGTPQKSTFNSAFNGFEVLVTDTLNSYPIGNTSSFFFTTIFHYPHPDGTGIQFSHKYDSDFFQDGGMIETSHDNGVTWVNVVNDPMLDYSYGLYASTDIVASLGNQPGFSGTLPDWEYVDLHFNITEWSSDTIDFKFTFASDSIDNNTNGWMIDGMFVQGMWEGIEEYSNSNKIKISPNPSASTFNFNSSLKMSSPYQIVLHDQLGRKAMQTETSEGTEIDISKLEPGLYHATFSNEKFHASKKVIVQK